VEQPGKSVRHDPTEERAEPLECRGQLHWQDHTIVPSIADEMRVERQRLSAALDAAIPKPPLPEPTIVYVAEDDGSADLGSRNFDPVKWAKKSRSWW
jgi:hypothetical protein